MSESGGKITSVISGRLRIDDASNRLMVVDENNVGVLLAGVDDTGVVKVKLAPPGVDVLTATDDELVWSSDFKMYKNVKTIDIPLAFTRSSSAFVSYIGKVEHELTYTPKIVYDLAIDPNLSALVAGQNFTGSMLIAVNAGSTFTPIGLAYCYVDATYAYFQIDISTVASGSYTSHAYITLQRETFGT